MSTATMEKQNLPAGPPTDLNKPPENIGKLKSVLEWAKPSIAMALPRHLTPERMIRVAVTAIQRMPQLLECTQLSIIAGVVQASELGLELSGPLGHCYLVPFRNTKTGCTEAQFQVGYRGFIAMAFRTGEVEYFNGHGVRQGDLFSYQYGTEQFLKHVPGDADGETFTHFYACFRLRGCGADFEVMSKAAVDAHRKRYSRAGDGKYSPWSTAYEAMAIKTVIRRLAKRAPMSIELAEAVRNDEETEIVQGSNAGLVSLALPDGRVNLRANGAAEQPEAAPGREPLTEAELQAEETLTACNEIAADMNAAESTQELDKCRERMIAIQEAAGEMNYERLLQVHGENLRRLTKKRTQATK